MATCVLWSAALGKENYPLFFNNVCNTANAGVMSEWCAT